MSEFRIKPQYTLDDVPLLMKCLRDPVTGCPWDKTQTHESIRQDLIEETYEAVEAIDRENTENLKEELGDMLMNIALHAEIEREKVYSILTMWLMLSARRWSSAIPTCSET